MANKEIVDVVPMETDGDGDSPNRGSDTDYIGQEDGKVRADNSESQADAEVPGTIYPFLAAGKLFHGKSIQVYFHKVNYQSVVNPYIFAPSRTPSCFQEKVAGS